MRAIAAIGMLLLVGAGDGCKANEPSEIAERGWAAHEAVIAAGEHAATCAEAGPSMQRAYAARRDAFVAAMALDGDPARMAKAAAWLEAHGDRYRDLEDRMTALADRCAGDPTVVAVFAAMENPLAK